MASNAADVARRPEPASCVQAEAEALVGDLRSRGFDLRRQVFVAYVIELHRARDLAYLLWRRGAEEQWRSSLYADGTGWVVRLGRLARPRADALARAGHDARELAAAYDGTIRGVYAEDLAVDDPWSRLADLVCREQDADAVGSPSEHVEGLSRSA